MITGDLDPRVLRVTINIEGRDIVLEGLSLSVKMEKTITSTPLVANIEITNLENDDAQFIITSGSPFYNNRTPRIVTIEAGRVEGGVSLVFKGNIFRASSSQPPDRVLTIESRSYFFDAVRSSTRPPLGTNKLSTLCALVAEDLNLRLDFQADDKQIRKYSFSGGAQQQLKYLSGLARINVYSDVGVLYVRNSDWEGEGIQPKLIDNNDFVGMPVVTERGVSFKLLYNLQIEIGDVVQIDTDDKYSLAANGDYHVFRLEYSLATRENDFYVTVHAARPIQNGFL